MCASRDDAYWYVSLHTVGVRAVCLTFIGCRRAILRRLHEQRSRARLTDHKRRTRVCTMRCIPVCLCALMAGAVPVYLGTHACAPHTIHIGMSHLI